MKKAILTLTIITAFMARGAADSHESGVVSAATGKHYAMRQFPDGISLSVPTTWKELPVDEQSARETTAEPMAEEVADGLNTRVGFSLHRTLLWIAQPLAKSNTEIKVTVYQESDEFMRQEDLRALAEAEVMALDEELRNMWHQMMTPLGLIITRWSQTELASVGGNWFLKTTFQYDNGTPGGEFVLHQYQLHDKDRLITFTFSTGLAEERMWKPVFDRVLGSLDFAWNNSANAAGGEAKPTRVSWANTRRAYVLVWTTFIVVVFITSLTIAYAWRRCLSFSRKREQATARCSSINDKQVKAE